MSEENNLKKRKNIVKAKSKPKEHKMSIEDAICEALEKRSFMRKKDLIDYVEESSNYEVAAIEKVIAEVKNKLIIQIGPDQLWHYGIKDPDGRAVYFTLKQTAEINDHVNKILNILKKSKDKADVKLVINELDSYERRYVLDQNQLDIIVDKLDFDDYEVVYNLARIIFTSIYSHGILPSDDKQFTDKIKELLARVKMDTSRNFHVILIWILGLYNDDAVISNLKKDLENFDLEKENNYLMAYMQPFTSRVIETHRSELFDFQRKLEKSGKKDEARVLSYIRPKANENVRTKRYDESVTMPDGIHIIYKNVSL
jgi:hypothetical protein